MAAQVKHRAVADSLQEVGDRLFTLSRLPPSQWRSGRTTNASERLHEEFKRRIGAPATERSRNWVHPNHIILDFHDSRNVLSGH